MLRTLLTPFLLTAALALVGADAAQAQTRNRSGRGYAARPVPRNSEDVKLAPGMRLGRPMPLTTDYMGRPLKPKNKLTSASKPAVKAGSTSLRSTATPAKTSSRKKR
ncbi:hypothetical protein [Hymenobacter sp. B81]|uniref:hypothetical protein n=1 Tax=Hymenobacter sp. B81 TaxID=3344878 RepID=UPI0037DC02E8